MACLKLQHYPKSELIPIIIGTKKVLTSQKTTLNGRSGYLYGFNGQEKDDEVAGNGNVYTAEYWQYDSRLGRRWNMDPVVKHHQSPYATFSNNPIIYVDPEGNTDYYNTKGKKIGTDGINNNQTKVVLTKQTQKIIRRATKEGNTIAMNEKFYTDIMNPSDVPSMNAIKNMDVLFERTEVDQMHEEALSVAKLPDGAEDIRWAEPGKPARLPEIASVDTDPIEQAQILCGYNLAYTVHTHPDQFLVIDNNTGRYQTTLPTPSGNSLLKGDDDEPGDFNAQRRSEALSGGTCKFSLILGYERRYPYRTDSGTMIKDRGSRVVTIYNGTGGYTTMRYKEFKKAAKQVSENFKGDKPRTK